MLENDNLSHVCSINTFEEEYASLKNCKITLLPTKSVNSTGWIIALTHDLSFANTRDLPPCRKQDAARVASLSSKIQLTKNKWARRQGRELIWVRPDVYGRHRFCYCLLKGGEIKRNHWPAEGLQTVGAYGFRDKQEKRAELTQALIHSSREEIKSCRAFPWREGN